MTPELSNIGFHSLRVCAMGRGPATRSGSLLRATMMAEFQFSTAIESLFPYINALADKAEMFEAPALIRFRLDRTLCALYPDRGLASPFDDHGDARQFVERLILFLNDTNRRRAQIPPRHKLFRQADTTQILKLLPRTNCNDCGFKTCMAFAAILARQQTVPGRCPHIIQPVRERAVFPVLDDRGELLSTIALDVDYAQNDSDLDSAKRHIQRLEKRIRQLTAGKEEQKKQANGQLPAPLSKREIQVLQMVAWGASNGEIGELLCISPHTVKSHITHIFNKLGVNSRAQASVWASRHHFV